MKKKPALLACMASILILAACSAVWTELDNPVDEEAPSYQGFETVADPADARPAKLALGTLAYMPTLICTKVLGAESYMFQISDQADFAIVLYTSPESELNKFLPIVSPGLSATTTYYWRVSVKKGGNWSSYGAEVATFSLSLPVAGEVAPVDASETSDMAPLLNWNDIDGASGYELQVANASGGLASSTAVATTASEYPLPAISTRSEMRYWRVRAKNAEGAWGAWSSAWSFSIPAYFVGDRGPATGIVFYDKGSESDGWRYLEAAASDQSTGITWDDGNAIGTGATAWVIGTGEANTALIVSVKGAGSYAASLCASLSLGGYEDWFLPSVEELRAMYQQRALIGGFAADYYWGSSEFHGVISYLAYAKKFDASGDDLYDGESRYYRARAVRAF